MPHHTKDKGDLACVLTIADLSRKGYVVFSPVVCEHLPFDLIAYKDGRCHRIQCKYSSDGVVRRATSWASRAGNHIKLYQPGDFDYFALYLHKIDTVIYPPMALRGCTINITVPAIFQPFYWYGDFLDLTDNPPRRTYQEFEAPGGNKDGLVCGGPRKVARPTAEALEQMLWTMPTTHIARQFGVSDSAVGKWAKACQIRKPPRGYWAKQGPRAAEADPPCL